MKFQGGSVDGPEIFREENASPTLGATTVKIDKKFQKSFAIMFFYKHLITILTKSIIIKSISNLKCVLFK